MSTGFEQYTTALEMTLLAKGERGKKEALSKRVAVLLESDTQRIQDIVRNRCMKVMVKTLQYRN